MRELDKDQTIEDLQKRVSELETQVKFLLNDKDLLRPQWEYTNIYNVYYNNVINYSTLKQLNGFGEEGWEICSSSVVHDAAGNGSTIILLKRRKFV